MNEGCIVNQTSVRQFKDPRVIEYINLMARSLSHEYHKSLGETYAKLSEYNATLRQVFDEDPEIVLHDDPAKWAEIFAVRFGWAEKRKIEFV